MAYGKLRDLVQLATELQATSIGFTVHELAEKMERSRQTVDRMLAGLFELGLEPTSILLENDHHLTKRWKIEGGVPTELLILQSVERTGLERHLTTLPEGNVRSGLSKLLAKSEPLGKHIAVDTAELIEKTTHIGNIGPRLQVNAAQMSKFENAILGFQRLRIKYRAAGKPKASWRTVEPLGLLFGRFGYLVANNIATSMKPLTYRLDLVENIEDLGEMFEEPTNFNFREWARDSFGIFHGDELLDIKLRFTGEAAKRARKVQFHPSQKVSKGRGGSTIIELRCRGHRELIHELCHPDWVGQLAIEKPDEFRTKYFDYVKKLGELS
ncbi:MAG: hypothetical protein CMF69_07980 [Magnetovibrio sp.]|nr:hypothetical protein [Magnetovibrio sp.]|tara:strand:+ start:1267 stop:2244 length:978 start_codon:yes stop_codon:yes gene_type:complete